MANFLYKTATELGCILDCILTGTNAGKQIGTLGTPTDNTAIINAFLAQATTEVTPVLILDGPSAMTGIKIPHGGNASIIGLGKWTGFWINSGSNAPLISNNTIGLTFDPGLATPPLSAPTPAGVLYFSNFYLNGNRGNGTTGNSNSGSPKGNNQTNPNTVYWYCGLDIYDAASLTIEDVEFYDIPAYSIRHTNSGYWKISGIRVTSPSNAFNTDGIHANGPNGPGTISDCPMIQSGDDAIAINLPEGYGGNIAHVKVANVNVNANSLMRVYTYIGTQYYASDIGVSDCGGSATQAGFILGAGSPGSALDAIQDLSASNIHLAIGSSGTFVDASDNLGIISFRNCTWDSPAGATAFLQCAGITISSMDIEGKIYRSTRGSSAAYLLSASATTLIKKLALDFAVENEAGESYSALADLLLMTDLTVSLLYLKSLDASLITALADSFTNITAINGPGVLSSGLEIPDGNMANNCPYISSTSGAHAGNPCIVISGTAKLFTTV